MDKQEFTDNLKNVMGDMTEEEIEKAISALKCCKTDVYKKSVQNKSQQSELMANAYVRETHFKIRTKKNKNASLKVLGASVLSYSDYNNYKSYISLNNNYWWLRDKYIVGTNDTNDIIPGESYATHIRPIIIVDNISSADLAVGNIFYINDEKFRLISESIAIKTACLEDRCTYMVKNYQNSIISLCVRGWYDMLIAENIPDKDTIQK